ncbi:MAG: leucine-rich repeat domain-containing protein [Clostridia bacterium]|nr:leucine-rich repeat domain-containing protein [Clostridia bacterium]
MTALKKPLSGILAFILVFAFVAVTPVVAFAEDGEEIEFSAEEIALNKKTDNGFDYVRTADGSAAIIVGYSGTETELKMPGTINNLKVISVADDAFAGNTAITSIKISNNVTEIGDRAFMGCTSLKEITGIKSVESFGESAFEGCSSLTEILIPDTVVNIPTKCFAGCSSLSDIKYHKNLKGVVNDALEGTAWENNQPDGGLTLGRILYSYKGDITNLVIPEGVSIIEPYTFLGCEQIKTVEFGPDVEEIGLYAFQNCVNLEKITCSPAVSIIRAGAFKGCSSLVEADFSECTISTIGYESFSGCTSLSSVKLHETLSEIGDRAFEGTAVETIELGKNVNSFGKDVFLGNEKVTAINVVDKNKEYSSQDGVLFNKDGNSLVYYPVAKAGSYELPQGVEEIREGAFKNSQVTEIVLSHDSALNTIRNNAFEGSALTAISLPDAVTVISSEVFKNAVNLKSVELGSSVTAINKSAFEGCKALTEINLPDSLKDISAYAFKDAGLVSANIGNGVVRIGSEAFANNASLKNVVLGECLEKLSDGAFMNCRALVKINLPANVNDVSGTVFEGCIKLKKITIANDNANYKIAAGAIYSADGTELVLIANNTLTALKIADGTEVIAAHAFDLAKGIAEIAFPGSLINVKDSALDVTSWYKAQEQGAVYAGKVLYKVTGAVPELELAEETVSIADNAVNNKTVRKVTIPKTVKYIGSNAFEKSSISAIVIPESVTAIGNSVFKDVATLKKVVLSKNLEVMGKAAFKNCFALQSITLPLTLKNIPVDAFANCKSLTKVNFGSVETIGKYAFSNCENLIVVDLPVSLTAIDPMSFCGCTKLEAVNIAEGNPQLKSVEGVVLKTDENNSFNTIALYPAGKQGGYEIAEDIKFVADKAFYDCDGLTEVVFPDGIESIGTEAFFDCDAIISITLPEGAKNVGDYAFASCNELREFVVNSNLTEYSENVFDGCYYFNLELVNINVTESSAMFIGLIALIFIVVGVVWYFKYQKKQVKLEQEIKEKIAERELLEKAKRIKEEMAEKE